MWSHRSSWPAPTLDGRRRLPVGGHDTAHLPAATGDVLGPAAGPLALSARWRIFAPLALAAAALSGCSGPGDLPALPPVAAGQYILGPGDEVRIITFGAEQLTGQFKVGDNGDLAVPLLGNVHAAGLTSQQLSQELTNGLVRTGMFKSPSVAVEVAAYRPIFVLGEVTKPGQYPYQPGMTVLTAIAIAGGFTYRAVTDSFSVVRTVAGGKTIEGIANRQTTLQPGDVITVYERHF